ncbi:MAG TPA: tetratricopeptide repeat protein [Pyrinomonadaceae bacterium]|nr:tetratricopeptide repeat protein [Pyrinomonadaceae bacterium]
MRKLAFLFCLGIPAFVFAQHDHMQKMPVPTPVKLVKGLGSAHHPVSTKNKQAQAFFDQGLAYMYAFNHDEAVRSFQHAAELDPDLAMAYWGMSLARGSNYNWTAQVSQLTEAWRSLLKAQELAATASARDQAYINALSKRYAADPIADQAKLAAAYNLAMKDVTDQFPNDLDAATLYAESIMNLHPWQLWSLDGKPNDGTLELLAVLEGILKRDPDHTGANHYYIHAVEASPHPERALPSARRIARLAPNAGHLVHMPSHIYIRTGDYSAAAGSNADAIVVDEKYIKSVGGPNFYSSMYTNHNIHFLACASAMRGRYGEAMSRARELQKNALEMLSEMPMLEYFALYPMVVEIRFHKWENIKKIPEPPATAYAMTAFRHFARGLAYAMTGDKVTARNELDAFRTAVKAVPADLPMGLNAPEAYFGLADQLLAGEVATADGDVGGAITSFNEATKSSLAINYDEPPDWDLPIAEFLGPLLLKLKRFKDAEQVYDAELQHHPNNGRALFGLAEALKRQGKTAGARNAEGKFRRAWRQADTPLTAAELYR